MNRFNDVLAWINLNKIFTGDMSGKEGDKSDKR